MQRTPTNAQILGIHVTPGDLAGHIFPSPRCDEWRILWIQQKSSNFRNRFLVGPVCVLFFLVGPIFVFNMLSWGVTKTLEDQPNIVDPPTSTRPCSQHCSHCLSTCQSSSTAQGSQADWQCTSRFESPSLRYRTTRRRGFGSENQYDKKRLPKFWHKQNSRSGGRLSRNLHGLSPTNQRNPEFKAALLSLWLHFCCPMLISKNGPSGKKKTVSPYAMTHRGKLPRPKTNSKWRLQLELQAEFMGGSSTYEIGTFLILSLFKWIIQLAPPNLCDTKTQVNVPGRPHSHRCWFVHQDQPWAPARWKALTCSFRWMGAERRV